MASSLASSPLIPQHGFNQVRHLAQGVSFPRNRRGLRNFGLLCIGPICLIILICYNRIDGRQTDIFGTSTVESIVRKGQNGYRAATGRKSPAPYRPPKGKLRLEKDEDIENDNATKFLEENDGGKSWKDTLVDKFFPDPEATSVNLGHSEMEEHIYMDNGLVAVNPHGRHPIYDLLDRSQKAWQEKSARQSTTLQQAVKEYRRRYQRSPPKGFDLWCVLA